MSCRNLTERRIVKTSTTSGEKPTIPASDNHQDGSWLVTDIYPGEIFHNRADGIMWTRAEIDGVDQIMTLDGYTDFYRTVLNQSAGNAPVPYHTHKSISGESWSYSSTGVYLLTKTGAFPQYRTQLFIGNAGQISQIFKAEWVDANTVRVKTFSGGASADGVLVDIALSIHILPAQSPAS